MARATRSRAVTDTRREAARRRLSDLQHADSDTGTDRRTNGTTEKKTAVKLMISKPISRVRSAGDQWPKLRRPNTETIPEKPAIAMETSARVERASAWSNRLVSAV